MSEFPPLLTDNYRSYVEFTRCPSCDCLNRLLMMRSLTSCSADYLSIETECTHIIL